MYNHTNYQSIGFTPLSKGVKYIMIITGAVYILQFIGNEATNLVLLNWFAVISDVNTLLFQPWRFVTYMFLHDPYSIWHILWNMLFLWWMGSILENKIGQVAFITLYIGSGIGGAIFDVILSQFSEITTIIGASGAIYGVMVAFAVFYPRMPLFLLFLPPIPIKYFIIAKIAIDIISLNTDDNVARLVHLGGALTGYLLIIYYKNNSMSILWQGWYHIKNYISNIKTMNNVSPSTYSKTDTTTSEQNIDIILDKIAKHGYEKLSEIEKQYLFEISKKNAQHPDEKN